MENVQNLEVELLTYKPDRKDPGDLKALAESIKTYGLQQPLIVQRHSENGKEILEVIDGRRRLEACKKAGMSPIPCIIRDKVHEDIPLICNTHRLELSPVELFNMAEKYVKKELDGDPTLLPPEKVKAVAMKLNMDINATYRILNIGRIKKVVRQLIIEKKMPLKLALLSIQILDDKILTRYCNYCIKERPNLSEALEELKRVDRTDKKKGKVNLRSLYDAVFVLTQCKKCRSCGTRDPSLFEEDNDEEERVCFNPSCFNEKTKQFFDKHLKRIIKESGIANLKYRAKLGSYDLAKFNTLIVADPEMCKKCKKAVLIHEGYGEDFTIKCPPKCANIKRIKRSSSDDGIRSVDQKKASGKKAKDETFTVKQKKEKLDAGFALAARKAMLDHFFVNPKEKPLRFRVETPPLDHLRILFFVGVEACKNPFAALNIGWVDNKKKREELQARVDRILKKFDLKLLAKEVIPEVAYHLGTLDQASTEPKDIDDQILKLYGRKNWCARHYKKIVEKLSRNKKKWLEELDYRPDWSKRGDTSGNVNSL